MVRSRLEMDIMLVHMKAVEGFYCTKCIWLWNKVWDETNWKGFNVYLTVFEWKD